MSQGFFTIRDHRDMLAKAERERKRMEAECEVDNVFNFFVTAYHVRDYVINGTAITMDVVDEMINNDPDFRVCRLICNKGKHLELDRGKDEGKQTEFAPGAMDIVGLASVLHPPFARTQPKFFADGQEVHVHQLGLALIAKWGAFFTLHGI